MNESELKRRIEKLPIEKLRHYLFDRTLEAEMDGDHWDFISDALWSGLPGFEKASEQDLQAELFDSLAEDLKEEDGLEIVESILTEVTHYKVPRQVTQAEKS